MAINAAKILCAQGNLIDGRNYIRQSINVIPDFLSTVKKDLELGNVCKIDIKK
jgi:hypothetical protein